MKHIYLICYDVADPKRLRKVYKTLQGAGESLQYSVFRCELSKEERQKLIELLWDILNLAEDRLLVANLGHSDSRGIDCLQYWGVPREEPNSTRPIVL
ncbi:MAG: CRISPR-associated endonuclease Cas2 [Planctomycetaceae bacterium]|nr:CRISPR-associated endonuclease Cas2 [Planctomycetaceae bacterium]